MKKTKNLIDQTKNEGLNEDYLRESRKRHISRLELAVLYIRVSTELKVQDDSYDAQFEILERKAKEKGFVIYKVYQERYSAAKLHGRDEFDKMIADAEKNKFSAIFIKDLSRISRNTEVSGRLKRIVLENEINIYSITEGDRIEKNSLMYGFASLANEAYSQDLSKKIKASLKYKAEKGEYTRNEAPYGYHVVNRKLIVNNDETPDVVRLIHKLYQEGDGCLAIAKKLTQMNYDPPRLKKGKKNADYSWKESGVRYILLNKVYVGDLIQHKEESISITSNKRKIIEEPIVVENCHEAIISRECYELTQMYVKKRSSNQRVTPKSRLFSDVIYCATCGNKHWYRSYGNRYVCGSYARYGKKVCSSHVINEDELIKTIKNDFLSIINSHKNDQMLDDEIQKKLKQKIYKNKHEMETLRNTKIKLDEASGKLILAKVMGDINESQFEQGLRQLKIQLQEIDQRITQISSEKHEIDLAEVRRKVKFAALGFDKKTEINRDFVNRFIDKIVIRDKEKIEIHYSFMEE